MSLVSQKLAGGCRRHVVLAPRSAKIPGAFGNVANSPNDHDRMLSEIQRLRGRIYLREGAIQPSQLTADGRDACPVDHLAWHLLTLDQDGSVGGCVRMLVHPRQASFENLIVSHSTLAKCPERGLALRSAVGSEIVDARSAGSTVVEVGGWVLTETMRCSTEAVRLALGVWAWGRLLGGAVGIATATVRNHSARILGRIGGRPLRHCGEPIPQYFEPKYGCDIQILRFDSNSYNGRYAPIVESLCGELTRSPVLSTSAGPAFPLRTLYPAVHAPQAELAYAGYAT